MKLPNCVSAAIANGPVLRELEIKRVGEVQQFGRTGGHECVCANIALETVEL